MKINLMYSSNVNLHKGENKCNFNPIRRSACKIQCAAEFKAKALEDCFRKFYHGTEWKHRSKCFLPAFELTLNREGHWTGHGVWQGSKTL